MNAKWIRLFPAGDNILILIFKKKIINFWIFNHHSINQVNYSNILGNGRVSSNALIPFSNYDSVEIDLTSVYLYEIPSEEKMKVSTKLAFVILNEFLGWVCARSGLADKYAIALSRGILIEYK